WTLKPQILAVPGVAQAQIFGGESRERQLWVDPVKLNAAGVTLEELSEAARRATLISGGGYLETAVQRLVLRAQAPAESLSALGQAVVATPAGVPVRIGDIAQVRDGAAPRFGDAMIGGHPGILVETSTQYGANTLEVTRGLEHRLEILATQLAPRGVRYHPALLRPASFIESAIAKQRTMVPDRARGAEAPGAPAPRLVYALGPPTGTHVTGRLCIASASDQDDGVL